MWWSGGAASRAFPQPAAEQLMLTWRHLLHNPLNEAAAGDGVAEREGATEASAPEAPAPPAPPPGPPERILCECVLSWGAGNQKGHVNPGGHQNIPKPLASVFGLVRGKVSTGYSQMPLSVGTLLTVDTLVMLATINGASHRVHHRRRCQLAHLCLHARSQQHLSRGSNAALR